MAHPTHSIIVNKPGGSGVSAAELAVAAIVLVALIAGFAALLRHSSASAPGIPNTYAPASAHGAGGQTGIQ